MPDLRFVTLAVALTSIAACGATKTSDAAASEADASEADASCPPESKAGCYYAVPADAGVVPTTSAETGLYPQDYCDTVCPTALGWKCGRVECTAVVCAKGTDTDAGQGARASCETVFQ